MYDKNSRSGFILLIALVVTLVFSGAILAAVSFGNSHRKLMEEFSDRLSFELRAKNAGQSSFAFDALNNSDGNSNDVLSCSGATILCTSSGSVCPGQWIGGADGIVDSCNNDDYLPTFSLPENLYLLTQNSPLTDNDSKARYQFQGNIPPGATNTVMVLNDRIAEFLVSNAHNNHEGNLTFGSGQTLVIQGSFSHTGSNIYIDRIDRMKWRDTGRVDRIGTSSGIVETATGFITNSGNFSSSFDAPLIFDGTTLSYAIQIQNPTSQILSYTLETRDTQNVPVYSVPIDDTSDPWKFLYTECLTENNKYYCREKLTLKESP